MTLPGGFYVGPMGRYEARLAGPTYLSRAGAHVPGNIADQYLGRAGIGPYARLGAPSPLQLASVERAMGVRLGDLCDNAGSTVGAALAAAGGSSSQPGVLSQIGTAAHADAGSTTALGVASAVSSFIGNLWGNQCQIQDARAQQTGSTSPTQPSGQSADMTAQFQAAIQQALHQSTSATDQQAQLAVAQQQAQLAAQQAQQRTLLIGGGIALGVLVLGGVGLAFALKK